MIQEKQIQKRIAEAIKQSGFKQTELAQRLNISQSTIAHYIKGDICPSLEMFANLCQILELDTNYILCQE